MTVAAWLLALLVLAIPGSAAAAPAVVVATEPQLAREVRAFTIDADDKDPGDSDVVVRFAAKPKAAAPKK